MQGIAVFEEIQHSMGLAFSATRTKNLFQMTETPLHPVSLLVDLLEHKVAAAATTTCKTNKKKAHKIQAILQNLRKRFKILNKHTNQLMKEDLKKAIPPHKHLKQLKILLYRLQRSCYKFLSSITKSKLLRLSSQK
jgi:hypothetical protein